MSGHIRQATMILDTLKFEIRRDVVGYTGPGHEPDPDWRHTDAAGHDHAAADGRWPTLREVTFTQSCGDPECCGESWEVHDRWECPICRETITPGYRATVSRPIYGHVSIEVEVLCDDGARRVMYLTEDQYSGLDLEARPEVLRYQVLAVMVEHPEQVISTELSRG